MIPLDLDYARAGYLRSADGTHCRHVIGLDVIASDLTRLDVAVYWHPLSGTRSGCCDCERRRIYLAPWVYWSRPRFLIRLLSHECGHTVVGPSQERAHLWSTRTYGDLLVPVWV